MGFVLDGVCRETVRHGVSTSVEEHSSHASIGGKFIHMVEIGFSVNAMIVRDGIYLHTVFESVVEDENIFSVVELTDEFDNRFSGVMCRCRCRWGREKIEVIVHLL